MMFRPVFWVILPCKMVVDNHFTRQYNPEDSSEHVYYYPSAVGIQSCILVTENLKTPEKKYTMGQRKWALNQCSKSSSSYNPASAESETQNTSVSPVVTVHCLRVRESREQQLKKNQKS
jgi:hypothetical protein